MTVNQAQYDLDRLTAKITALPSGELRKHEYLTGDDLRYRASVLEQTKFGYYPLGKVFNKGLNEDDKKEGLFKRLKNIEGKNEKLLKEIKEQKQKSLLKKIVKQIRLKILWFMILNTLFTNTD